MTGLLANAVSFAVSFCCLTAMQRPRDRRSDGPAAGGVLDGLRFAWRNPNLRAMAAFSSLGNLALTGVDALLVVFPVRTIGLSPAAAGLVMASLGVGGVLGALAARPLGRRFGTARACSSRCRAACASRCCSRSLTAADLAPVPLPVRSEAERDSPDVPVLGRIEIDRVLAVPATARCGLRHNLEA